MQKNIITVPVLDIVMETIEALPAGETNRSDLDTVVCLHGFPDNNHAFDLMLEPLTKAGYRVLVPTYPCFDKASIPNGGGASLLTQAKYVMEYLDVMQLEKVHFVGHDRGGMLVNPLLAMNKDRFITVTNMCCGIPSISSEVAYSSPTQLANMWYALFFNFRDYADRVVRYNNHEFINILWNSWSPGWNYSEEEIESVKNTLRQPGVTEAALDTYRYMMLNPQETSSNSDLVLEVPVLYVGGKNDGCINECMYSKLDATKHKAKAEVKLLNCGHFPHREIPEELSSLLIEFFKA